MSLVTEMFLVEKYGLRLNLIQLSEVVGIKPSSIRSAINLGSFPIPTYLEMNKRYADYRDVAAYFEACKERAAI